MTGGQAQPWLYVVPRFAAYICAPCSCGLGIVVRRDRWWHIRIFAALAPLTSAGYLGAFCETCYAAGAALDA
jgi:hypothetical protein